MTLNGWHDQDLCSDGTVVYLASSDAYTTYTHDKMTQHHTHALN